MVLGDFQVCVLFLTVGFVLNYNTLDAEFTLDDKWSVLLNPVVKSTHLDWHALLSRDYWGNELSSPSSHKSFRPLTSWTFWMDNNIASSTHQFHKTNVVLHGLVSFLVYLMTKKAGFKANIACLSGLLFLVHPIHCECVANISGRAEILGAFFSVSSVLLLMHFLVEEDRPFWSTLVFLCGLCMSLCAVLSKETGIMGVMVLLLYAHSHGSPNRTQQKAKLGILYAWFILVLVIRVSMNGGKPTFSKLDNPLLETVDINTLYVNCNAFFLLLSPSIMCADYSGFDPGDASLFGRRVLVTICATLLIGVLALRAARSSRIKLAFLWLTVPYIPAMNIFVRVGFVIAERTLYTSSIGWAQLVAYFLNRGMEAQHNGLRTFSRLTTTLLFLVFSAQTTLRNADWHTNGRLWSAEVQYCNATARAFNNLGKAYQRQGKLEDAKIAFVRAIEQEPLFPNPFFNLGMMAQQQHGQVDLSNETETHIDLAIRYYKHAITLRPRYLAALRNLGMCYEAKGDVSVALEHFKTSLRINPNDERLKQHVMELMKSQKIPT
jgi:protein O-mannosyl-transferase